MRSPTGAFVLFDALFAAQVGHGGLAAAESGRAAAAAAGPAQGLAAAAAVAPAHQFGAGAAAAARGAVTAVVGPGQAAGAGGTAATAGGDAALAAAMDRRGPWRARKSPRPRRSWVPRGPRSPGATGEVLEAGPSDTRQGLCWSTEWADDFQA